MPNTGGLEGLINDVKDIEYRRQIHGLAHKVMVMIPRPEARKKMAKLLSALIVIQTPFTAMGHQITVSPDICALCAIVNLL